MIPVPAWKAVLIGAMAGGMGWGIRGQFGHETGAMMAGSLVCLALVLLFTPGWSALPAARAAAWGAIAMGFGGSMTYGQTVGLTHNPELVGNWAALRWGLLGLGIKGALWIGFAGVFLGMGLGGVRYRAGTIALLMLALLGLAALGTWMLNRPFDPARQVLPPIYFSADWRWQPGADLKPRPEVWGGYLFAFIGLFIYVAGLRRDRLARQLGLWGLLGGAIGFPLGQCLQAWHAWNPDLFRTGAWASIDPHLNWWNWMETTFGTVMGACLGLGLWLNRHRITPGEESPVIPLPGVLECCLLLTHVLLLTGSEFTDRPIFGALYDPGLQLGWIPVVVLAAGRWSPMILLLPVIALPVIGKTVRELVYLHPSLPPAAGWLVYGVVPFAVISVAGVILAGRAVAGQRARSVLLSALMVATWLYWALNFAFFEYPWPWETWTRRTPNGLWFTLCAVVVTALACRRRPDEAATGAARRGGIAA